MVNTPLKNTYSTKNKIRITHIADITRIVNVQNMHRYVYDMKRQPSEVSDFNGPQRAAHSTALLIKASRNPVQAQKCNSGLQSLPMRPLLQSISHHRSQRLFEVRNQILRVFQTDMKPHHRPAKIGFFGRAGDETGGGQGQAFVAAPGCADPKQF